MLKNKKGLPQKIK